MFYTPPPSGGGSQDLQQVTDVGNTTTNDVIAKELWSTDSLGLGVIMRTLSGSNGEIFIVNNTNQDELKIRAFHLEFASGAIIGSGLGRLLFDAASILPNNLITWSFPYLNGATANHVLAPYTDPNGSLNYVGFYMNNGVNVYGSLAFDGVEGALELVNGAGFVSNLKTLATSPRLNTLPDEDGTLAIKKFDEYNTTIQQTGGSPPVLQGDEISTNAALTASFNRSAAGIYEVVLSLVTTKIVASATSCAALTTGNPYLVIVKKLNTTTVQLTVLDAIGVPTDDWEFLNITIKYTI